MSFRTYFIIIASIFLLINIIVALFIKEKDLAKKKNCTKKTTGKIIKFSSNAYPVPIVEYEVGNDKYLGKLKYTYIITKTSPFQKNKVIDYEATVLRIYKNSISGRYSPKDYFLLGGELNVYYNPDHPKTNYVLRYCDNVLPKVLIISSVVIYVFCLVIILTVL